MILYELLGTENHPAYQALEIENVDRQYDFLRSIVAAAITVQRPFLSTNILKALNFHAIACLHTSPGQYRPCRVTVGSHEPPEHYRVEAHMDDFVNTINRFWEKSDPVLLAAHVLWRLNYVHPFINGNGRTARAACYYVLCVKAGGWLPGTSILPELIKRERDEYVAALQEADQSLPNLKITRLHSLLSSLVEEQLGNTPSA